MATASFEGLRDGGNRADIYVCGVVRATVSLYCRQLDHVNNRDGLVSSGKICRHQTKAATGNSVGQISALNDTVLESKLEKN